MPSERDFTDAARAVRTERDRLAAAASAVDRAASARALSGGTIGPVVDAGLAVSADNLRRCVEQLDQLAVLCDRRAAVCAQHAAALFQWQRRAEHWEAAARQHRADPTFPAPGSPPARPSPPSPWVEPR